MLGGKKMAGKEEYQGSRIEDSDFIEYAVKKVWEAAGASEDHAKAVANCIVHGDRMGKVSQGVGVLEAVTMHLKSGALDIKAEPVIEKEAPSYILMNGKKSTGHYTLTIGVKRAIEKAKENGICLLMAYDHFDCGCFSAYSMMAMKENMIAFASNNSVPLMTPRGGVENVMSCPPFTCACPTGEEEPIVVDVMLAETYDGDISKYYYAGEKLPRKILVDPNTGEITDDPAKFFEEIEGYGRISDCNAASTFDTQRLYAMNIFAEILTGIMVPNAVLPCEMPTVIADWLDPQPVTPVGGSFVIVIDPSHFQPYKEFTNRADKYVRSIKNVKKAPDCEEIFLPGERAQKRQKETSKVEVFNNCWVPFVEFAKENNVDIENLREEWNSK